MFDNIEITKFDFIKNPHGFGYVLVAEDKNNFYTLTKNGFEGVERGGYNPNIKNAIEFSSNVFADMLDQHRPIPDNKDIVAKDAHLIDMQKIALGLVEVLKNQKGS